MDPAFQLLDEPWIKVRKGDKLMEVSLKEAFSRAHELGAISGELATQDVAILRLMLAAMYGAVRGRFSTYQSAMETWHGLFEKGQFEEDFVNLYLEKYRERFWLCHPINPFFQVAGLETKNKTEKDVTQMIADVPSRSERRFFSNMSGKALHSLTFAEAARWLLHLHAWDYAGKKASVIGGSPDGGGTGWCGKLGVVFAQGSNLFETLMYNFVLVANQTAIPITSPFWENEPKTAAKEEIEPQSYVELLALPSRRALLLVEEGQVTGVTASYGDVFSKENRQSLEQMSGWHISSVKGQGYIPTTHSASRSMWRDLGSILPQRVDERQSYNRPGGVDWVANSIEIEARPDFINLCAVGYEYGAMMGVVNTMVEDSLQLNATLLSELGADWAQEIIKLLSNTEEAVSALGKLSKDIAAAAGSRNSDGGSRVQEQAYYELDEPFRDWLRSIDPSATDEDAAIDAWKKTAAGIIKTLGAELIASSAEQAFVGREVEMKGNKKWRINAPIAQRQFNKAVKSCLGW